MKLEIWALVFAAVSCIAALSTMYVFGWRLEKFRRGLEKLRDKLKRWKNEESFIG